MITPAATVALERFTRLGVLIAVVLGAAFWLAEDFGGILTGQGTDPNSGLLLIVIAAAFWPLAMTGNPSRRAARGRRAAVSTVVPASGLL
jgi:drug/metabolite transporter (DMT)-like permease